MDPFNAFSLACGVIQIVDFSIKVAKKCHELYKDGASSENEEVEDMVKHLTDLHKNLDLTDQDGLDELTDLGLKCSKTAKELIAELQKLKVNRPHRKREVISKTLRGMRKRGTIEEIQKRLGDYRRVLDCRILVDLRFVHCHNLYSFLIRAFLLHLVCEDKPYILCCICAFADR